ncbi:MAG: Gfo/Idh/MocA family oxidoreductase, partial [Gammaproteobacteria bacterium]
MTVRFGLLGSGRIGRIHASNIVKHAGATLKYVVDTDDVSAAEVATENDAVVADTETVLGDPEVTAIVIATPTDTHADLIIAAARAGKAVFCEKPIALSVQQIQDCLRVVDETNILLGVGFNRRFDPSIISLREAVLSGQVGSVEIVSITSRDPSPPPAS